MLIVVSPISTANGMISASSSCSPLRTSISQLEPGRGPHHLPGRRTSRVGGEGAGGKRGGDRAAYRPSRRRLVTGSVIRAAPCRSVPDRPRPGSAHRPAGSSASRRPWRRTTSPSPWWPARCRPPAGSARAPSPRTWKPSGSARRSRSRSQAGAGREPQLRRAAAGQLSGRRRRRHSPVVDDHDPVGEQFGLVEQVGGQQDGHAVSPGRPEQVPHQMTGLRVHTGGRLVEEQHLGSARPGPWPG